MQYIKGRHSTSTFNQPLNGSVENMEYMFSGASSSSSSSFNQPPGSWNLIIVSNIGNMPDNTSISTTN